MQVHDALGFSSFATPGYGGLGGAQYAGLPSFLIRDGSIWWESPDIYLTHPNHPEPPGDLYIPDALGAVAPFNNTITVDVRNVGTHPVRKYSLGFELFKTGIGTTNDQNTILDKTPTGGLLLPIDPAHVGTAADLKDVTGWNTPFTVGTTHECIRVEAKLLSSSIDFSWNIVANDFEGQRNTDEMPLPPMPPSPPPWPDLRLTEDAAAGWTRVKVILDRIRIMRDYDPLIKGKGELVFTTVVTPDNDETAQQVTRLPGSGVYSVSDKPGGNEIHLGTTVFEGVVKNGSLSVNIGGREMDLFDPDDDLTRYSRVFSGNPETWFGDYRPVDEYLDKEDVGDWALWYRIVRA